MKQLNPEQRAINPNGVIVPRDQLPDCECGELRKTNVALENKIKDLKVVISRLRIHKKG